MTSRRVTLAYRRCMLAIAFMIATVALWAQPGGPISRTAVAALTSFAGIEFNRNESNLVYSSGTGGGTVIFNADFESGTGHNNWTFLGGGSDGNWIRGVPTPYSSGGVQMDIAAYQGTRVVATGINNNQDLDGTSSARSPNIVLPAGNITLQLAHYFSHRDNSSNADSFYLEIRNASTNATMVRLIQEVGASTSRNAVWSYNSYNLSPYAGSTVYIFIRGVDGANGTKLDAAIDAVSISSASINTICGTVFEDVNMSGAFELTELGVSGISVKLFDAVGLVAQTTSNSLGNYEFLSVDTSKAFRIEFSNIPSGFQQTVMGADHNGDVRLVNTKSGLVHFGLYYPETFCEPDPFLILPCYEEGAFNGPISTHAGVVKFKSSADGHDFNGTSYTSDYEASPIATFGNVGTVYGVAWQKQTKKYYVSSFHKRYTSFGPGGPDAIYQLDLNGNLTGTIKLDVLTDKANSAGKDYHNLSPINGHIYDLGLTDSSFINVTKTSFGDIEINQNDSILYAVNLFDRRIYSINIASGNTASASLVNSWATPDPTGASRHRPFGLAWKNNRLWLGTVDANGSNAYVHSFNPATGVFTLVLTIPLNYARQAFYGNANNTAAPGSWNAWMNTSILATPHAPSGEIGYPQAILSDIEFAANGDMILGFRDRFGDQTGAGKYFKLTDVSLTWAIAQGDILKACFNGTNYILETGASGACPSTAGISPSGPGGVEFYHWDLYALPGSTWNPNSTTGGFHWESTQGGLLQLKNLDHIITTAMDPFNDFSGGVIKLNNSDGGRAGVGTGSSSYANLTGGYTIFESGDYTNQLPPNNGTAAKANGLGDLEAACILPIVIGNFVWYDANSNGIQDANEAVLKNVTVELYQNDTLIGQTTTDSRGYYFFGGLSQNGMLLSNEILSGTSYEIRISILSAQTNDGTVNGVNGITSSDAMSDSEDWRDSDASLSGNGLYAFVALATGKYGTTNYSFDFGFGPCNKPTCSPTSNGPLCTGSTLNLTAGGTGAASWQWTGPNGFSSTLQNPSRTNVVKADSGLYKVLVIKPNGCIDSCTINVVINTKPTCSPTSNGPLCSGSTLNLTAGGTGAVSWQWTGPNNFSSTSQNPSRTNVVKADSGLYKVVVTGASGCKDSCTINVVINTNPTCSPTSNGPLCSGSTLNLTSGGTGAVSWQWTGPNGYSSTSQNPSRTNVVKADSGLYKVVVTGAGGCKDSCTINVVINLAPTCSPSSNGPLCSGETLLLNAGSSGVISWQWTGPNGFSSALQNPTRSNISMADAGEYKVVVTGEGGCQDSCTINVSIFNDVVVEAGMPPGPICSNGVLDLSILSASITGGIGTGTWTTTLDGSFNNSGKFGGINPATQYSPGPLEIMSGLIILNLTSDDPPGPCEPKADAVMILLNDMTCSQFPWTGN